MLSKALAEESEAAWRRIKTHRVLPCADTACMMS